MSLLTGSELLDALRLSQVLDADKVNRLTQDPVAAADSRTLARELLRRDWLTPFQANLLLQGRGAELLMGNYILLERLGEGGMGQVFKARHARLGRVVALKVIRKERLSSPDIVRRFQREIRAAAQLNHPNVVAAFDAEECSGTLVLAMEYVEGVDLGKLLKERGPLPVDEACTYVQQAALGLQHACERGLVHRDVKPSNLLVSAKDGTVKLLDLGLARQDRPASDEEPSTLTEYGVVMGTPDYMAPEQIEESRSVDIRADIYSLGCTLYHLLSGRPPFQASSVGKKLAQQLSAEPAAIETLRPDVPPAVAAVLRRMMAKRREDRYATPLEAAHALRDALETRADALPVAPLAPLAPPVALPAPLVSTPAPVDPFAGLSDGDTVESDQTLRPRLRRSRRRGWLIGAAGVLFLLGVGVCLWAFGLRGKPARPPENETASMSPLDRLDASQIPTAERFDWQPPELVAVLGNHSLRHDGHSASVIGVACSPDGRTVASVSSNGLLCLWDIDTGREQARLRLPAAPQGVAFDRSGTRLAVCDSFIRVFSWDGSRLQKQFELPTGVALRRVAFQLDGDLLAAPGSDGIVRVWDLRQSPPKATLLRAHAKNAIAVAFSADGRTLFSAGADGMVCRWDRDGQTWTKGRTLRHELPLADLALAADGRTLATASKDGWVFLWDLAAEDGKPRSSFQIDRRECHALAFSPDGKTLAVAGRTKVTLWTDLDRPTQTEIASLEGQIYQFFSLAFTPQGDTLVSGGNDLCVRVWRRDGAAWRPHLPPTGHTYPLTVLAFAADGQSLASASSESAIFRWQATDSGFVPRRLGWQTQVLALAFAPDGRTLASGSWSYVSLLDPDGANSQTVRQYLDGKGRATGVAFTPDGRTLAASYFDGSIGVWSLNNEKAGPPLRFKSHDKPVNALALSPRGRKLASAGEEGTVRLWTGSDGRWNLLGQALEHPKAVTAVAFSADAETLISACADGVVRLWDVTGTKPYTPPALEPRHTARVLGMSLSADGKVLASVGDDKRLIWWDASTWTQRGELRLHLVPRCLAVAPDGRHVAVGNDNGTIYILRLPDGVAP